MPVYCNEFMNMELIGQTKVDDEKNWIKTGYFAGFTKEERRTYLVYAGLELCALILWIGIWVVTGNLDDSWIGLALVLIVLPLFISKVAKIKARAIRRVITPDQPKVYHDYIGVLDKFGEVFQVETKRGYKFLIFMEVLFLIVSLF